MADDNQKIETELLIRIFGMRRSGNHAIIYWLLEHERSNFFFNNSNVPLDARCLLRRLRYKFPYEHKMTIVGWENAPLNKPMYLKNIECQKMKTIIIMRDPFNWLASYMKKRWGVNEQLLAGYMEHLNEFTGETNNFKDKICINYNQWFVNRDYRESIVKQLGFEKLNDDALDYVPEEGGGSSFDRLTYRGNGSKMDVTNRWQQFMKTNRFHSWLKWPNLLERSKQVWPDIHKEFWTRLDKKSFL